MVEVHAVTKRFTQKTGLLRRNAHTTTALQDVSLTLHPGKVFVLLGPNGSGKTTLLKLISTLLFPDSGAVRVCNLDTRSADEAAKQLVGIAVAHERSFYPRLTARENLAFFASLDEVPRTNRHTRIGEVLASTGLSDESDKQVMSFSSGMYQRLGIARALLKQPKVLLLDEPSRSLDPASCIRFWELVRAQAKSGAAVLITTHNLEEAARVGDEVGVLLNGRLLAQRSLDSSSSVEELRHYYFANVEPQHELQPIFAGRSR